LPSAIAAVRRQSSLVGDVFDAAAARDGRHAGQKAGGFIPPNCGPLGMVPDERALAEACADAKAVDRLAGVAGRLT
jgi:hypothetical protein